MRTLLPLLGLLLLPAPGALAQHTHGAPPAEAPPPSGQAGPHAGHEMPPEEEDAHARMQAAMTMPLGLPMTQMGSGTSWLPPATPMFGHMALVGDWALMGHYNLFAGLDAQGTPRGATQWPVLGWGMGMARGPLWGGQLTVRGMLSPEPLVQGRSGYALLLQTGETAYGRPLVDRQHPHDLFMELALLYQHALTRDVALELYVAPAGEPALGPTAYPHRLSALTDPLAPLSHHWQDSTHIAFGVLTAGVYSRWGKLEASAFNGKEPGEERLGVDLRLPDSWSVRGTVIPGEHWALQASVGYLTSPEASAPGENLRRTTASLSYTAPLAPDALWSTTAVWGENFSAHLGSTHAFLLEGNLWLADNVLFGRAELVQKTAHDVALASLPEDFVLPVGSLALGYARTFGPFAGLVPGVGVRGTLNVVNDTQLPLYGTRFPLGGMVYVSLRPEQMMRGRQHGP